MTRAFSSAFLSAFALPAFALLACSPANVGAPDAAGGEGGAAAEGGPGAPDASDVCANVAYARCSRVKACSPTYLSLDFGDFATCQALYTEQCQYQLSAPSTGATPARISACATALMTQDCSDVIYTQNQPPDCTPAQGALPAGAPCSVNGQCQTSWCSRPAGTGCGVCAMPPAPGAPCQTSEQCAAGATCTSLTNTCADFAQQGTACGPSQPCSDGLSCVGGICVAGVATAGASCDFAGAGCDEFSGLACNAATGTCKPLVIAEPGQACGTVADQSQICLRGTCIRGVCVSRGSLGQPCDLYAGPPCTAFTVCILTSDAGTSGTCQLPGAATCP